MVKMKKEKAAAAVQPEKKKAKPAEMISEPAFVDKFGRCFCFPAIKAVLQYPVGFVVFAQIAPIN